MIKAITVTNHLGESVKMELRFPEKSGFLILNVDGLGPSKANINSTELATTDGSVFNSAKVNSRNIVMTLKLLADPTIEETRQRTYKYFPVKKMLKITIETDIRMCEIYGYVESNTPNIFSNSQTTQISIICPDPYFYSIDDQTTMLSGIEALLEFPMSNESVTEQLINLGEIYKTQEQTITYTGDSEVGTIIYIHALGDVTNITVYNLTTRELMLIDTDKILTLTGSIITNGDNIIISTIKGDKYITLIRQGEYINILNCVDKNANWFTLAIGDNIFGFKAETGTIDLQFKVENKIAYEGV